ncbi:MAG: PqiC family protein [Pseudomonadota bacterium]
MLKLLTYAVLLSLLAGCSTQPSQPTYLYQLNAMIDSRAMSAESAYAAGGQPRVGVGPVQLASYLDRPQIVTRLTPYRIELDDFHHWAGKLQENITLVLVDVLQAELGSDAVIAYPWHRAVQPAYLLTLDIGRFDAEAGQLLLQVRWTLLEGREVGRVLLHGAGPG